MKVKHELLFFYPPCFSILFKLFLTPTAQAPALVSLPRCQRPNANSLPSLQMWGSTAGRRAAPGAKGAGQEAGSDTIETDRFGRAGGLAGRY